MDLFAVIATVAAVIPGAIAAISGFGIGSVLTPRGSSADRIEMSDLPSCDQERVG